MTTIKSAGVSRPSNKSREEYPSRPVVFCGCPIDLSRKPFIPAPETEWWVGQVAKIINKKGRRVSILDIFAGSGCIGIAIYRLCPGKVDRVGFAEKYSSPCSQIKINCELNQIPKEKYRIFRSDVFQKVRGKYDYIFAHPPYVPGPRFALHKTKGLAVMPKNYFIGGRDGLLYVREFLKSAKKFLNNRGTIFMGHDRSLAQKTAIEKILRDNGYTDYVFHRIFLKEIWGAYGLLEIKV